MPRHVFLERSMKVNWRSKGPSTKCSAGWPKIQLDFNDRHCQQYHLLSDLYSIFNPVVARICFLSWFHLISVQSPKSIPAETSKTLGLKRWVSKSPRRVQDKPNTHDTIYSSLPTKQLHNDQSHPGDRYHANAEGHVR